jgi:hypothetical protein
MRGTHFSHGIFLRAPGCERASRQRTIILAKRLQGAGAVTVRRVLVNMHDGKMFVEFDAASREELEAWLAAEGFHFDWLLRIELEAGAGPLAPVA